MVIYMSNYGSYQPFNMIDGLGVRCSIYFSGCPLKCKGCYNKAIQDKNYGFEFTQDNVDQILEDCSKSYVSGLSILGGEPMENTEAILDLIKQFRNKFGNTKDIWLWSGYTFEEINYKNIPDQLLIVNNIDVLVDGRFVLSKFIKGLPFRGSTNQRIIDVSKTLENGKVVEMELD